MSAHDRFIHAMAGVRLDELPKWGSHEIGCCEMAVPRYYETHPYRGRANKATGNEGLGLKAVLAHNGIKE